MEDMSRVTLWNGPICNICDAMYFGTHKCSREDIERKIAELQSLLGCPTCGQHIDGAHFCPGKQESKSFAESCPCNPKNDGSGICGCILGGAQITC